MELRRLVDAAGLSFRVLEESTSAARSDSGQSSFYSKSQWGRWLSGQSRPPRKAVRKLAEKLAEEDIEAEHLVDLWGSAFVPAGYPQDPATAAAAAGDTGRRDAPMPGQPEAVFLVGRDSEMALLTGLIREVARGRGGSVLIEGEPGIGKSALVRAAVVQAPQVSCQVFWGAGDELGQALPLLPFLDALQVREPSANPRRNAIVRLLHGEIAAGRGADVPAVLAEQLLALVAEQCAVRPIVLVIDDLQWADQASITLWGRLARSAPQVPLLLVGMMRPVPQRDDLLALRRVAGDAARLQLAGLSGAAVADLVAALAGGRPDGNLLRLAGGAAGNPLYVTELVAALARGSGLTITETGAAELAGGSAPSSLSAAIADRLGFAARPVREVLRAAALLGVDFAVPDLAVVLGRGVADLIPAVDEACAAGVLAESGRGLGFRHPLIRAALYDERPAPARAAWHRDAGRALAEAGAPPDRVARSLDREHDGALPEALATLTDAFDGNEELEEIEYLLANAVCLAAETGDLSTAQALAGQAAAVAAGSEIPHRQANALYCCGVLDHDAQRLLAAAEHYDQAGTPLLRAKALETAAGQFVGAGDRGQARAAFSGAMEVYASLGATVDVNRLQAAFRGHGIRRGRTPNTGRAVAGTASPRPRSRSPSS